MQLLITRSQKEIPYGRPVFSLSTRFELMPIEAELIAHYKLENALLTESSESEQKKTKMRAHWYALVTAAIAFVLIMLFQVGSTPYSADPETIFTNLMISGSIYCFAFYFFYHQFREEIMVRDLIQGRFFFAYSVAELMAKEEEIRKMASAFRHLLEAMKTWDSTEVVSIDPGEASHARLVIDRSATA